MYDKKDLRDAARRLREEADRAKGVEGLRILDGMCDRVLLFNRATTGLFVCTGLSIRIGDGGGQDSLVIGRFVDSGEHLVAFHSEAMPSTALLGFLERYEADDLDLRPDKFKGG
jgi:hypothetical protein